MVPTSPRSWRPASLERIGPRWIDAALLVIVAGIGLCLLAPGLAHPSIHNWDEAAHQAATRGTLASFFRPHIYAQRIYPTAPDNWMAATVFLHKPTGPFWFGALMMRLLGITPLALRLGSLFGGLAGAAAIYALARRLAGRALAFGAAVAFLALPFGYQLTHGYLFGDVTDCTLAGWVATAMFLLVRAAEKDDARWAALAGAATGVGYLCKTALALAPAGVALALALLGAAKLTRTFRWRCLGAFALALVVVAVPWNAYTAWAYPGVYAAEAHHTLAHLFSAQAGRQWVRPWDGLINEINALELGPIPVALTLLALLWGIVRSVRRRERAMIALTLWVGASWLVLSVATVKVPATAWGAVPGVLALLAVLLADAARRPALAGACLGAAAAPLGVAGLPAIAAWAHHLPAFFSQTRTRPELFVGAVLAAAGAAGVWLCGRGVRRFSIHPSWGVAAMLTLAATGVVQIVRAQKATARSLSRDADVAPMREVGLALDRALPAQSMIFLGLDRDPPCCFELQDLMFWSGRMAFRHAPDLATAAAHHLHPYLVSVAAEPYQPIAVPGYAAARAYDLAKPAPSPALPPGVTTLHVQGRNFEVLGYASGQRSADRDVWAFYLRARAPFRVPVAFETDPGVERTLLEPSRTLSAPQRWLGRPWFVVTVLGPHRAQVKHLRVNGTQAF